MTNNCSTLQYEFTSDKRSSCELFEAAEDDTSLNSKTVDYDFNTFENSENFQSSDLYSTLKFRSNWSLDEEKFK